MKAKDNDIEHSEARSTGIFEKKKKEETVLVDGATSTNMSNDASQRKPRRRLRNRRTARAGGEEREPYHVDPLLLQKVLSASNLPVSAYSFEVVKTVQRCVQVNATHVALQLPEGLLLYATVLADVLTQLAPCLQQVSILSDVTYGACCVDDITAASLGCQLLVHYGHSCLVPLQHTVLPVLYVFCEIQVHVPHLVECLIATLQQQAAATSAFTTNNSASSNGSSACNHHIYLLGTVQFRHCLVTAQEMLIERGYENVTIPQCKPLSPGEVLGCTSPTLRNHDPHDNATTTSVCFVADGRFHLESTMISNPWINTFYRYDPYSKAMTVEAYGTCFSSHYAVCAKKIMTWGASEMMFVFNLIRDPYFATILTTAHTPPDGRPRPNEGAAIGCDCEGCSIADLRYYFGHIGSSRQSGHRSAHTYCTCQSRQAAICRALVGSNPN